MKKIIISLFTLALYSASVFAQAEKIRLYEGKAPGSENWTQQEFLFEYTSPMNPGEVGECILNVVDPELWSYLPAKGTETGAAVVVCPGGGFTALSWHQEGPNVAKWLAAHPFVRQPGKGCPHEGTHREAREDCRRTGL